VQGRGHGAAICSGLKTASVAAAADDVVVVRHADVADLAGAVVPGALGRRVPDGSLRAGLSQLADEC
jgi:hypothetical protein